MKNLFLFLFPALLLQSCTVKQDAVETIDLSGVESNITEMVDGTGFEGEVLKVIPSSENRKISIWKEGDTQNWSDNK